MSFVSLSFPLLFCIDLRLFYTVLWRVGACVSCLVVDPFSHVAAAFAHSEEEELCKFSLGENLFKYYGGGGDHLFFEVISWSLMLFPCGTVVYMVDPSSPQPLAVHSLPSGSQTVVGASFAPRTLDMSKRDKLVVGERSDLFFITKDQVRNLSMRQQGFFLGGGAACTPGHRT